MRLSLRFVLPLLIVLAALTWAVQPLADRLMTSWFQRDLDLRANLIASTVSEPVAELVRGGGGRKLLQYFTRITEDERLFAMGFCDPAGHGVATATMPPALRCDSLAAHAGPPSSVLERPNGPLLVSIRSLAADSPPAGRLVLVHDMSFVVRRSQQTRQYLFYFFVALAVVVSLITVIIAQLSWRGWEQGVRALLRGEGILRPAKAPEQPEFGPIARDVRALIRDLDAEHRERHHDQVAWSPEALRDLLDRELRGQEVIVVSNREPIIHWHRDGGIVAMRPASGLVTALEPIVRACSGTWIAHGSGDADREVVDAHDRVGIPAEHPAYRIRRVWLTPEEEAGYYYGFSNEGLWPLCHIAHVRPVFRSADFEQYRKVNERFARAVVQESSSSDPIVLVQDYHFALLPRLIHESLPDATIVMFWHIPWPIRRPSPSVPGASSCSTASWAAASWASTPSSTATTSWRPSSARSRRASTARRSWSRTGASRRRSSAIRSRSRGPCRKACWTAPSRSAAAGCANATGFLPTSSSASASTGSTTPRGSRSACAPWSG